MLSRFYQLVTSLYAGGYRILAVFLVDALTPANISTDFAKFFFWAGLLCSCVGVPIAARSQVRKHPLTHWQQSALFVVFLAIAAVVASLFWNDSTLHFCITLLAASLLSMFEINRMERASEGHFALLTGCSIASLALLILILSFHQTFNSWLIVAIFSGLALPVTITYISHPYSVPATIKLNEAVKPVSANALSSLISTGLTFIVPLLLIEEFGSDNSALLAQIYSVAAMAYAYPRYLSAGFIVAAKQGKATLDNVKLLARKITLFALASCSLFAVLTWWLSPNMLQFILLFVAMQMSQLTLPYANWWTSHGKEFNVMLLNFSSLLVLCAAIALVYLLMPQGEHRGQAILGVFVGYQILRYAMYSGTEKYRLG